MPEYDTVWCFLKHLNKHIHDFDSPRGPTVIRGISSPPKETAGGTDFQTDPHDREAIAELGVLDLDNVPEPLGSRRIHSVQQIGSILEVLLPRDDFDPEAAREQTVDVLRIVFKNFAEIGWVEEMDIGLYPAAYLPGTEQDRVGRTRVSAIIACDNMKNSDGQHQMILLDSLSHVNWAMLKVRQRTVRRDDGGLGSEKWFLRAYGQGYDPIKAPYKWGPDMADTFLGRNGRAFTGPEFTGPYAYAENQKRCILLQAYASKYGFPGHGFRMKSENAGIHWCAQRDVYRGQVPGRGRAWRRAVDLVSKLSGITRIGDFGRQQNLHLIAIVLSVAYQFLIDASFQDESFDLMTADVGKKVAVAANFLIAYEQTRHVKIGRPANNPQDVKFKAYIHQDVLSSEPEEWAAIQAELGLSKLGEPLTKPGLTSGGIGQMAHGWSTNGPKGDQKHYERQSVPGPKQESGRQPEYNSDGERVDPSYTLNGGKGGKNQRRLRDIDDGTYGHAESDGTRAAARKLYECVMSHLGFSQEDFLPGKREELNAKRKAERTPAEVEAAQATRKAKRWRHRQRKKEQKATEQTEQVGDHARKSTVEASRTQSGLIEDVPLSALPPHALASPALAPAPANAPAPADAPVTPARVPLAPTGADLVSRRVGVWWPIDDVFLPGRVVRYTRWNNEHEVLYDGGSRESLDLSNERWKILEAEDEASPCSSRDGPCNEAPRSEVLAYDRQPRAICTETRTRGFELPVEHTPPARALDGTKGEPTAEPTAEQEPWLELPESMRGRCSLERFQRAQFQLVDLMAGLTRPGVRLERDLVRETARSTIRDTGLLDYVLKHMEGRTVSTRGRIYRYLRERNEAGHVVCWVEEVEEETPKETP